MYSRFCDVDSGWVVSTTLDNDDPLPTWLSFTGSGLSGTPDNNDVGEFNIKVTASDGQYEVSDVFALTVNNINEAPSLTDTPAILTTGTEDTAYTIHTSDLLQGFKDIDGDHLAVSQLI